MLLWSNSKNSLPPSLETGIVDYVFPWAVTSDSGVDAVVDLDFKNFSIKTHVTENELPMFTTSTFKVIENDKEKRKLV